MTNFNLLYLNHNLKFKKINKTHVLNKFRQWRIVKYYLLALELFLFASFYFCVFAMYKSASLAAVSNPIEDENLLENISKFG